MSLLTPVKVPVKVYRWDDAGAPALDKTAGCVATIFKACLVTGYGTKEPAGWTMPFEDTTAGIKVLRPEVGPHTDFYLRLSADTGKKMNAEIRENMTDANTGDLKISQDAAYSYAEDLSSGKWVLIASPRGFAFFCESATRYGTKVLNRSGSYFIAGDIIGPTNEVRAVFMQHSVGNSAYGDSAGIFKGYAGRYLPAKLFAGIKSAATIDWKSTFEGYGNTVTALHLFPVVGVINEAVYLLTGILAPSTTRNLSNYTIITNLGDGQGNRYMALGTSSFSDEFVFVNIDEWMY